MFDFGDIYRGDQDWAIGKCRGDFGREKNACCRRLYFGSAIELGIGEFNADVGRERNEFVNFDPDRGRADAGDGDAFAGKASRTAERGSKIDGVFTGFGGHTCLTGDELYISKNSFGFIDFGGGAFDDDICNFVPVLIIEDADECGFIAAEADGCGRKFACAHARCFGEDPHHDGDEGDNDDGSEVTKHGEA